ADCRRGLGDDLAEGGGGVVAGKRATVAAVHRRDAVAAGGQGGVADAGRAASQGDRGAVVLAVDDELHRAGRRGGARGAGRHRGREGHGLAEGRGVRRGRDRGGGPPPGRQVLRQFGGVALRVGGRGADEPARGEGPAWQPGGGRGEVGAEGRF